MALVASSSLNSRSRQLILIKIGSTYSTEEMKKKLYYSLFLPIKIRLKIRNILLIVFFITLSFNILNVPPAFAKLSVEPTNDWAEAFRDVKQAKSATGVVNAGNYIGNIGTIGKSEDKLWRVDRQPSASGIRNIQIQRNGVGSPSTAAAVLVPDHYNDEIGSLHGDHANVGKARFGELTRAIRNGLTRSIGTHRLRDNRANQFEIKVFQVRGNFSA